MRYPRSRDSPLIGWLLLIPVPLAVLCFGAVHEQVRAGVFGVVIALSVAALLWTPRQRLGLGVTAPLGLAAALASVLGALPLLVGGPEVRALLQPGLAEPLSELAQVAGTHAKTLALDPARGWLAVGSGAATVFFALAVAVTARSRRRRLRLAMGVVATAVALLALQAVHEACGWTELYGSSGVSAFTRYPSFGSFVSHNHGAVFLAAALPLAAALAARPHREWRLLGWSSVLVLCGGLVWAQSRGGVLSGCVALAVFASVTWGRRVAFPLAVLGLASTGAAVAIGVERAALLLTQAFMPGALDPDAFGNRRAVWSEAWMLVGDAPFVGVGPGGFRDGYKLVKQDPGFYLVDHAHSEPLQALVEHGALLGLVWVAFPLVIAGIGVRHAAAVRLGRRRSLLAGWLGSVAAILVGCVYDFPLRVGALGLALALGLGVVLASAAGAPDASRARSRTVLVSGAVLGLLGLVSVLVPIVGWLEPPAPALSGLWAEARSLEDAGESPHSALQEVVSASQTRLSRRVLDHEAAVWLVRAGLAKGQLDEARRAARALTVAYPSLPTGWLLLAEIEDLRGDRSAARSAWRSGLALDLADPSRAVALVERALTREEQPAAHAETLLPNRADRLAEGGVFLARRGDEDTARRLLERAAALDPEAALPLAHWLLQWGDPSAATAALAQAPRTGCRVQLLRGRAAREQASLEDAAAAFRRARAVCTSDEDLRTADLGAARVKLALKSRAAFEEVAEVLMRHPDHHGLRRELIRALHRAGRYDESVPHLDMLVITGVANAAERRSIDRITRGLPPL